MQWHEDAQGPLQLNIKNAQQWKLPSIYSESVPMADDHSHFQKVLTISNENFVSTVSYIFSLHLHIVQSCFLCKQPSWSSKWKGDLPLLSSEKLSALSTSLHAMSSSPRPSWWAFTALSSDCKPLSLPREPRFGGKPLDMPHNSKSSRKTCSTCYLSSC